MNFFGHAWLAARRSGDPDFVLGAMLPDLAPMAGLRIVALADPAIAAGHAFHLRTDAVFHRSASFGALLAGAGRSLEAAGVRRGPARGAAHVGVELLLDGWIAAEHGEPASFPAALAAGRSLGTRVSFAGGDSARALATVCCRIPEAGLPHAYADPAFTAERIRRVLARRPRLALSRAEAQQVASWAHRALHQVAEAGPDLLREAAPEAARERLRA